MTYLRVVLARLRGLFVGRRADEHGPLRGEVDHEEHVAAEQQRGRGLEAGGHEPGRDRGGQGDVEPGVASRVHAAHHARPRPARKRDRRGRAATRSTTRHEP